MLIHTHFVTSKCFVAGSREMLFGDWIELDLDLVRSVMDQPNI